jgi:hypothetical protein
MSQRERLITDLEQLTLRAVFREYQSTNVLLFKGALQCPLFRFADVLSVLGRWLPGERAIELSRSLLTDQGWGVLVEVLKHEMAHQYVDEVLNVRDQGSHGAMFRAVCAERNIDARASGTPTKESCSAEALHVLDRVAKLLSLAQSDNQHEAQAAMSAAQRLMLKYNIDAAVQGGGDHVFRHIGSATCRRSTAQRWLSSILVQHFFVRAIWVPIWRHSEGKRATILEVCGTSENVELASYVHDFLLGSAEQLWRCHKKARKIRSDAGRRSYCAGVMAGFSEKLAAERTKNEQEGLVWVGNGELERFFRTRHPRVTFSRRGSSALASEYAEGRRAGRTIVLHRGLATRDQAAGPRLLPGRTG